MTWPIAGIDVPRRVCEYRQPGGVKSEIITVGNRGGAKARQVQSEEDGGGAGCDGAGCDGADFGQVVIGKQSGREVFQAIAA
ncbi:MAG: hypothetical protein C0426_03235 [Rhodobacter sp.]|nr:hypothetical protein [Rhodobacter sp.]